jgi:phosphoglycolate phosphatase
MRTVFLDLDGTLIDPKEGITESIRYALEGMGVEDIPEPDELTWCIGPPLHGSFEILLGEGADIGEAMELYRERYSETGMYEAEIYDGIGEMFEVFRDIGSSIWIATSKPHVFANEIIEHFGISPHVDGLFGAELDGTRSDKTELLTFALDETGADPAQSVMIGDRRHDIFGAKNNDIASVGALWGYSEQGELHMAEADALAGDPEEAAEIVVELLGDEE